MHHLVGTAEIGEMLGVTRQRVHQLTQRGDFPAPVAHLAMGKIWERSAIEQWLESSGRVITDEP